MKSLFLSLLTVVALATPSIAAPLVDASSPSASHGPSVIPIGQNVLANNGKVTEAISVGTYTYLHVEKDGKDTWLAIPRRDIPVGAEIQYGDGAVMKDFHSSSLNRTFTEVVFLEGVMMAGETALAAPAGHPSVPANPDAQENLPNVGKVTESIPAGSYTYLRVVQDGEDTWLAIPRRDVPVGAEIRYAQGMVMRDFHSRSLNRTFDEVLFLGGVMVTGK